MNNNGWMGNNYNFNSYAPRYEITQVNGRAGAENFRMAPNSSYLLLDSNDPIVWVVKTDGGGLLTATAWDISPHTEPQPVDINSLQARIQALEEKLNEQSNSGTAKQRNSKSNSNSKQSNTEATT